MIKNQPGCKTSFYKRSSSSAILTILVIAIVTLGCGNFPVSISTRQSTAKSIQSEEISRGSVNASGANISSPQGAAVIIPKGTLSKSASYTFYRLKGQPDWMAGSGVIPAGDGIEFTLSGDDQLANPVEIRLPIKVPSSEDSTFYTIYAYDGKYWTDIGGIVEGSTIKTWTTHFTSFWPGRDPSPRRPIGFINQGYYNARVMVETYQPDPYYEPVAFPMGSTVSFAPTSPGSPNSSRYLFVPVGTYTFCYDWTDGKDVDKNGYFDYYFSITAVTGVFDYDPTYIEGAKWLVITPGRESKYQPGTCRTTPPTTSGFLFRTRTPTPTPGIIGGITITPTKTKTKTPTKVTQITITRSPTPTKTRTPTKTGTTSTRTPTRTRVNYLPFYNSYQKRINDQRRVYQEKNCANRNNYSGCWEDIFGMPSGLYLYSDYWANVHSSFIPLAQSLEDQFLAGLKKCYEEFLASKTYNLDVRKGEQSACISKLSETGDKEVVRIREVSCSASCSEQGKSGVVEGVPRACYCK